MGKGCQYHLEIQCANQVRINWGSLNISYFSFFSVEPTDKPVNHMTYSNFEQKSWNTFVTSFLLSILSLFLTFGIHFALLIVGFAFNCVMVLIFSRLIRPSVLFTSPVILVRRICLAISSFLNWRPFRLFSWTLHWIKKLSFRKKLKAGLLQ